MSVKYTVDKIAAFVAGCTNEAVPPAVRELVAKHLLDSIGCAIGAIDLTTRSSKGLKNQFTLALLDLAQSA